MTWSVGGNGRHELISWLACEMYASAAAGNAARVSTAAGGAVLIQAISGYEASQSAALRAAGVNVLALINSHAAAALQYGIERDFTNRSEWVVLYDMGAASTEAALVRYSSFSVKEYGKAKTYRRARARAPASAAPQPRFAPLIGIAATCWGTPGSARQPDLCRGISHELLPHSRQYWGYGPRRCSGVLVAHFRMCIIRGHAVCVPACSQFEVVDAAWDDTLGAEALDQALLAHFAAAFAAKHARDPLDSPKALAKLRRQARPG